MVSDDTCIKASIRSPIDLTPLTYLSESPKIYTMTFLTKILVALACVACNSSIYAATTPSIEFDLGNILVGGDGQGNALAGNEGKTGIDTTTGLFTTGMNFGHTYYNGYNSVSKSAFIDGVFNLGANKINSSNVSFNLESGDGSNASFDFITNNREIGGSRTIQFGNKTYSAGIGMSAGSGITFNLKKFREASGAKVLTFASDFGTMSGGDWKVRGYAVLSNSTKVLSSEVTPILTSNLAPYQFSMSVPEDADFLTLMVGTGGDGITDDHAGFGNARNYCQYEHGHCPRRDAAAKFRLGGAVGEYLPDQ